MAISLGRVYASSLLFYESWMNSFFKEKKLSCHVKLSLQAVRFLCRRLHVNKNDNYR